MADYAVTEFRSKDLAYRRVEVYEPIQRLGEPAAGIEVGSKVSDIAFEVQFEFELRGRSPLLLPRLQVGDGRQAEDILVAVSNHIGKETPRLFPQCSGGPHRESVSTVIVVQRVDIAGIEVQVTGVGLRVGSKRPKVAVAANIEERTTRPVPAAGGPVMSAPFCGYAIGSRGADEGIGFMSSREGRNL